MADVVQVFNSTCPANTPVISPAIDLAVGAGIWMVTRVVIVIPDGHAGLTGIQLWYGGGPAIPYDSGWFSGDGDKETIDLSNAFPQGVPWSVAMINNDYVSHNWQTRWYMDYVSPNTTTSSNQSIAVSDIYAASAPADNGS